MWNSLKFLLATSCNNQFLVFDVFTRVALKNRLSGLRININWKHGINALPVEKHNQLGRISIIFWGWSDLVEDEGPDENNGEIAKAEAFQRICKQFQIHGLPVKEKRWTSGWEHCDVPRLDEDWLCGSSRNVCCVQGQWLELRVCKILPRIHTGSILLTRMHHM